MFALKKLRKLFFNLSKKLLLFSRFLLSPFFSYVSHCLRRWYKWNSKVFGIINWLRRERRKRKVRRKVDLIFFLNCYLTAPWPTNPMLLTALWQFWLEGHQEPRNKVEWLQSSCWALGQNCRKNFDKHWINEVFSYGMT